MLTIAYMTNRRDPKIHWFFDSLHNETLGEYEGIKLIVVDVWADELPQDGWTIEQAEARKSEFRALCKAPELHHVPPKPTVWQGKHRLTRANYFAASNARNTALCLAPDGYIVFADDLSVVLPGWLSQVRAAVAGEYIALGTYKKVLNLRVENGSVITYDIHLPGVDSRLTTAAKIEEDECKLVMAGGSWMFGCSVAIPIAPLLKINGFDEDCDSMGMEDIVCGLMLERQGVKFYFDRQMRTLESEELHFVEEPFIRIIKPYPGQIDSSHAMLNWALRGRDRAPNYQDMTELRQRVLGGDAFPIMGIPDCDWRDRMPLARM